MNTKGTYDDVAQEVDTEDPIEVGDLLDDPRTDAEALRLCALLWSPSDSARQVSDPLSAADFNRVVYGELFETIATQVRSGAPHDPASIASTLTTSGRAGGHHGPQLIRALSGATIAGQPRNWWGTMPWRCCPPPTAVASTKPPNPWHRPWNSSPKTSYSSTC